MNKKNRSPDSREEQRRAEREERKERREKRETSEENKKQRKKKKISLFFAADHHNRSGKQSFASTGVGVLYLKDRL